MATRDYTMDYSHFLAPPISYGLLNPYLPIPVKIPYCPYYSSKLHPLHFFTRSTFPPAAVPETLGPSFQQRLFCTWRLSAAKSYKLHLASNVLGVCDTRGRFIYMLAGWEGSDSDSRVLRDALARSNGLRVPNDTYLLCDGGYMHAEGFLTPYKQTRYHLQEWGTANKRPTNYKELFNLKHSGARNVIERAFGVFKKRFAILRSPSFYPIETQCDIILACGLLHNFVMDVSPSDPLLEPAALRAAGIEERGESEPAVEPTGEPPLTPSTSTWWNMFRDNIANELWAKYTGGTRYRIIDDS